MINQEAISNVRTFNRFITQRIGVLEEGLLQSPYSLPEAKIIFEMANAKNVTTKDLDGKHELDAGYLSRIRREAGRAEIT